MAVLLVASCAATKETLPEALFVEPRAYVGTALSGPLVERAPEEVEWTRAIGLETHIAYHDRPQREGTPLTGRIVVLDGREDVFGTRSELARGARLLAADAPAIEGTYARPERWGRRFVQSLAPGITLALDARPNLDFAGGSDVRWSRWAIETSRDRGEGTGEIEVALLFEGLVVPRPEEEEEEDAEPVAGESRDPIEVRERLVLHAAPTPDGAPFRLVLPAPTRRAPEGGFVVELRLFADPAEALGGARHDEALARSAELVGEAHRRALGRGQQLQEGFRFESAEAVRALGRRELQRPALVFLAQSTGARLTEELALVAEAEGLGEFLAEIAQRSEALDVLPEGPRPFGWFLERNAWRWLSLRAEDEERAIEPELEALLLRHAGELGRYPDLAREAVNASADAAALDAQLVNENRFFLEDAHPAARVRAFDWLAERGATPEGYDPLGSVPERRAALSRAEALAQPEGDR